MGNQCSGTICQSASQQRAKIQRDNISPSPSTDSPKIRTSTKFSQEQIQSIVRVQSFVRGVQTRRRLKQNAEIKAIQPFFVQDQRLQYASFEDNDGNKYSGQIFQSDGQFIKQGYGVLRSVAKEVWQGYWNLDQFKSGKFITEKGILTGEFINQKVNGYGHFVSSDGKVTQQGQFKDDCFNGIGRKSGPKYQVIGQFKNQVLDGFGQQITQNGMMQGEWRDGMFVKGLIIESRSTYFGQMQNEMKHGKGITIDDDTLYYGEYNNSQKDGEGVYINLTGTRYYGQFVKNEMNGIIIKISANKKRITKAIHDLATQKIQKLKQNLVDDSSEVVQMAKSKIAEAIQKKVEVEKIKKEYQKIIDDYLSQIQVLANQFETNNIRLQKNELVDQNVEKYCESREPDEQKSEEPETKHILPIQ